jgi:phage terminase large subunit GpA-like protein
LREYALTGSEETLKTTTNTDQAMPYTPRVLVEAAETAGSESREGGLARYIVPAVARFLVATVDVQGGVNARFVVQIMAVGVNFEVWFVDRYDIKLSKREGLGTEFAPIDPASYAEDWAQLTDRVVNCTYKSETEGYELRPLLVAVDSGGEDGVTERAYAWYRSLRTVGLHHRVMLVKGASSSSAPRIRMSQLGGSKGVKGDVPVYLFNPNQAKDTVSAWLRRKTAGPNFVHCPSWLPEAFYDELFRSEVRMRNGVWKQVRKRNESFDLLAYLWVACMRLAADKIKDWQKAPTWALPVPENRETMTRDDRLGMKEDAPSPKPQNPTGKTRARRSSMSSYLG